MYNPNTTSKLYSVLVEDSISVSHATDSSDYWPGVVPHLGRRHAFTGAGVTAAEAIADLLDVISTSGLTLHQSDVTTIVERLLGLPLGPEEACDHATHPESADDCTWRWYLSVRFDVAPTCVAVRITYDDNVVSASVGLQVKPWDDLPFRLYSTVSESFWLEGGHDPGRLEELRRRAMRACAAHVDATVADLASRVRGALPQWGPVDD